jgi:hypothetical protein
VSDFVITVANWLIATGLNEWLVNVIGIVLATGDARVVSV